MGRHGKENLTITCTSGTRQQYVKMVSESMLKVASFPPTLMPSKSMTFAEDFSLKSPRIGQSDVEQRNGVPSLSEGYELMRVYGTYPSQRGPHPDQLPLGHNTKNNNST